MKRFFILSIALAAGLSVHSQKQTPELLNVPEAVFRYTAEGKGPVVVAFTGSENLGHSLYSDRLREHFTFIHADPQFIPESIMKNLTMNTVVEDIERVRKFLGIERISIMGHSMFGVVPLEYATKYPDHAGWSISTGAFPNTINLVELSNKYWNTSSTQERKAIREENLKLLKNDANEKTESERFWDQYKADVPMRFADPHFDMSGLDNAGRRSTSMAFINRFWGVVLKDYDNSVQYQKIKTPVLVISGMYDFGCPYFLWKDFGKQMPDYTFHLFEDAGHNPMLEVTDKFDQLLINWISAHN